MPFQNPLIALALAAGLMLCPLRAPGYATAAVPFWNNAGPVSNLTWSVAVHPQHPEIVFVGTEASGLYRSGDGGAHWTKVALELNLQHGYFPEVVFDPQIPDTMYAIAFDGLIKSTDAGQHWAWLATDTPWRAVSLAVNPYNPSVFYLARLDGFYRSIDSGAHFTKTGTGLPEGYLDSVTIAGVTGDTLLIPVRSAGVLIGVYFSMDGGDTWATVQGLPPANVKWNFLAVPGNDSTVFAASSAGLYKSGDSGRHWAVVRPGFCGIQVPLAARSGQALFAGSCDGVYQSTDDGVTWSRFGIGQVGEISALAANPADADVLWAATRNGLWVTQAGHGLFLPLLKR